MSDKAITFIIPGEPQIAPGATRAGGIGQAASGESRGRIKQSVRVAMTQRAGAVPEVSVTAVPGKDVVVLRIAGGPALTLHPENARDLLLSQSGVTRSARTQGAVDEVRVPAQLRWRGLEQGVPRGALKRSAASNVLLSTVEVVTDLATDALIEAGADLVSSPLVKRIDDQVTEGVYALEDNVLSKLKGGDARLTDVPIAPAGGAHLVLIHGTFSETSGTFGKLWLHHPKHVGNLFNAYRDQVYALDHRTLGASPIANAITLAEAMPPDARLHLLTHSRGGLVAEVLATVCANPQVDLQPFSGEAYAAQREELRRLASIVRDKSLRVDRVVRVACPARGTLLASKRLDAYLSVLKWALELGGVPVLPMLVDFVNAVAQRRTDPELIPGLAAQIPDSPLVQWLHKSKRPIAGELRVVAGDVEGDSVGSWVKTLLADGFFWTDNDFVVQTQSMYGGAPRAATARFLLHQAGKVSHFAYFKNEPTANAIVSAMLQDAPAGFRTIGPLSWAGESSTGVRAATPPASEGTSEAAKPAVFLLPALFGSHLKLGDERVWLTSGTVKGLTSLRYAPEKSDAITPDGLIEDLYGSLAQFLAKTHEVLEFPFDWRKPMEEEAERLGSAVDAALRAREKSGMPVRILAHSTGGLIVRTMQFEAPEIWTRMMSHPDTRVVMLGTPNGGTWLPMQVLSGDETLANALRVIDAPFREHETRAVMASFPGLLQAQAGLLDETLGLGDCRTWEKLASADLEQVRERSQWHATSLQRQVLQWGLPTQVTLDRAVALRKRLDTQRDQDLGAFADKLLLVVGQSQFTPAGYETGPEGLVYLNARDAGDGRVTLGSAMLPGVRTWIVDCEHGQLAAARKAFPGYEELLERGTTNRLDPIEARVTRGAAAAAPVLRSRPARTPVTVAPPKSEGDALRTEPDEDKSFPTVEVQALRVTITNGNLMFVRQPLLIGHYRSTRLTGTEKVMDSLIGGAMSASLAAGLYPESAGTHQIFVNTRQQPDNPWQAPRPEAVVVVGLGEEGKLRGSELANSVRRAVIAWSQRMSEKPAAPQFYELAATLIGSGGSGITVAQSAQLIAQGVYEANEVLTSEENTGKLWPRVSHLHLIELYLDRASEAWRAMQMQAAAFPGQYIMGECVQCGVGALPRPLDSGYRGTDYDFISAVSDRSENGDPIISYVIDTKRARTEVRAQAAQARLLRDLVAAASNDVNTDEQLGRSLFQLLVPIEIEPFLSGSTEMQIELDRGTAGIPWELLDAGTGRGEDLPWAIRTKLVRKFRTASYRAHVSDASPDSGVLIIGEPECDETRYRRLPGARREAHAIVTRLTASDALPGSQVDALIAEDDAPGADARTVITRLLERPWRIVHISGHGEPPELVGPAPVKPGDPEQKIGQTRGVVLSNGTFLSAYEIRNMRTVPELVFVNCCYLAARDTGQLLTKDSADAGTHDRSRFAAGVAEELIKIGVRCVIAAGWAVEDGPAMAFATAFYDALLCGQRFIDAVSEARIAAYALGGNTWGAYQCYGDPDWVFRRSGADAQAPARPIAEEFAGVASPSGLRLALETLAVQIRFGNAASKEQQLKLRHLEARFAALWGNSGEVAEAFGKAWLEVGDTAMAMVWLERGVAAGDGTASVKAIEQLANVRVRAAWDGVSRVLSANDELRDARKSTPRRNGRKTGKAADAANGLRSVIDAARKQIESALELLTQLTAIQPTEERESLRASAYKRLALIEAAAGDAGAERGAIQSMYERYRKAEELARQARSPHFFYPAMNRMAAELVMHAGERDWQGFDPIELARIQQGLEQRVRDDPDFWSVVGLTELTVYAAMAHHDLAGQLTAIEGEYADLNGRVSTPWLWRSVYDQAQFVLGKYAASGSAAERQAVNTLLAYLARLGSAGRASARSQTTRRGGERRGRRK